MSFTLGHIPRMRVVANIAYFGLFVLFAAILMLWRRADNWGGVPLPRRLVLAIRASRNWWLAYSVGLLAFFIGWCRYSFGESVSVVIVAVVLAGLLSSLRIPT